MVGLVDQALEQHLSLPKGLTDDTVTVIDPAVGTGTFLRSALRRIAARIEDDRRDRVEPLAPLTEQQA